MPDFGIHLASDFATFSHTQISLALFEHLYHAIEDVWGGLPLGAILFPLATSSHRLDMAVGWTYMYLVPGNRVCKDCTEKNVCKSDASLGVAETACYVFVTVSRYAVNIFFSPVRY